MCGSVNKDAARNVCGSVNKVEFHHVCGSVNKDAAHNQSSAMSSISFFTVRCEQLRSRNVKQFRGGLVFKAHRPLYHSTPGSRGIKQTRREEAHNQSSAMSSPSIIHAPPKCCAQGLSGDTTPCRMARVTLHGACGSGNKDRAHTQSSAMSPLSFSTMR